MRKLIACASGAVLAVLLLSGCNAWAGAQPQFVEQGSSPQPKVSARSDAHPQLVGHRNPAPSTVDPAVDASTGNVVELAEIPFANEEVEDGTLDEGVRRVLTMGVPGVKRLTYRVTFIDGRPKDKMLVRSEVLKRPVSRVVAVGTRAPAKPGHDCNANYAGCVPVAVDVDCAGGGNGPVYLHGSVKVVGLDIYHLDLDGDGRACAGPDDIP